MTEAQEQAALFQWAEMAKKQYPELTLMYHVPNGGSRNIIEARNLKRQGVKAGVPDICLPVARGGFHGLYIELKAGKGRPSSKQLYWLKKLNEHGNMAIICWGFEQARDMVVKYLTGQLANE